MIVYNFYKWSHRITVSTPTLHVGNASSILAEINYIKLKDILKISMFMFNRIILNILISSSLTIVFSVMLFINIFIPEVPVEILTVLAIPVEILPVEINNMVLSEIALTNINEFLDRNILILSLMDDSWMIPIPNGVHYSYSMDPIISSHQSIIVNQLLILGDIPLHERRYFAYNLWLLKMADPFMYDFIQHSLPFNLVMHM